MRALPPVGYSEPTMPSKTPQQARAMAAACYGKSTLGIPKKVGCEFARHDQAKSKKTPRYKKAHGL